jgi:hypothetical protein
MTNPIGPLTGADEGLHHQVPDTFAVVHTSDLGWTEKVCAMAAATDGSLQVAFGLGKYPNRNVMDAYAGISRGAEQITVRASRRLGPNPLSTTVGPIRYEVLEELQSVRFALDANECQPIAFEWTFEGAVPPALEPRVHTRTDYRVASDLVRYHHIGMGHGWVEVDGVRTEITPDGWVSTRDHSWGVRMPQVGVPLEDLEPSRTLDGVLFQMIWCPILMRQADGTRYGLHLHYQIFEATGFLHKKVEGGIEYADGTRMPIVDAVPSFAFDPDNRRLRGGTVEVTTQDGEHKTFAVDVVSDTGFHLGTGLYFGFDGHHHGEWRGRLHVDGERIANCATADAARRVHQLRDTVVHVVDRATGDEGWGNCQPMVTGGSPALGLTAEDSFV